MPGVPPKITGPSSSKDMITNFPRIPCGLAHAQLTLMILLFKKKEKKKKEREQGRRKLKR